MKFSSNFAVVMKTSSIQLPSHAGTLSIKSMLQSVPKHVIFILKIQKKILGRGHSPLPRPLRWGDTPSRTHLPQRLRRLDLRAFGAHSRTSPCTRKSGYGPETTALTFIFAVLVHFCSCYVTGYVIRRTWYHSF